MPTYEFRCQNCDNFFELSYSVAEFERAREAGIKCSTCGTSEVAQQIPSFQVQTSKKS
jgi:putative FmdB family regulatory protein